MRKSVLKRTLSIVLACIMIMSIFAALPMQAGATPAGRRDIAASCTFKLSSSSVVYTGYKIAPSVTVYDTYLKYTLKEGKDYKKVITGGVNAGSTNTLRVVGIGTYYGSKDLKYTVRARSINTCKITFPNGTTTPYNGNWQQMPVKITYNGRTLVQYKDYTLKYADHKYPNSTKNKPRVYIYGKGNFCSSYVKNYSIYVTKPGGVKFTQINQNKIKVDWSSVKCTGYQLQRYNGKNWVQVATAIQNSEFTTTYGPKYRVRAYVKNPGTGETTYSAWATYSFYRK